MTLHDRIMRARQAQVENEQKHDVQLVFIPFGWDEEERDWADPDLGRLPEPEVKWATENEVREHWHGEIDHEWEEWVHEHYDHEG